MRARTVVLHPISMWRLDCFVAVLLALTGAVFGHLAAYKSKSARDNRFRGAQNFRIGPGYCATNRSTVSSVTPSMSA